MQRDTSDIIRDEFKGSIPDFIAAMKLRVRERNKAAFAPIKKEYNRWRAMIRRCADPQAPSFKYYGGKGVRVCDRWMDFENFLDDMGLAPGPGYSIDRINGSGNYEPSNCRWATAVEQTDNRDISPPRGSVSLINGKWRAQVRVRGSSASKFFTEREAAVIWAEEKSLELSD